MTLLELLKCSPIDLVSNKEAHAWQDAFEYVYTHAPLSTARLWVLTFGQLDYQRPNASSVIYLSKTTILGFLSSFADILHKYDGLTYDQRTLLMAVVLGAKEMEPLTE